ncbi:hypothetical protein C6I21_04065 [Alkalicoccus urumqiensis]|uniref:Uncharacterized protein n=1 Tax=Alkalicoccus urumqiensis TaxID=1548213 RepID=A0A2P6MJR4_ALKUR|nr:hypothetical protein C6I21_04065 [Alkalicoccus urumqiensis]
MIPAAKIPRRPLCSGQLAGGDWPAVDGSGCESGETTAGSTFVAMFEACVAILQVIVAMFRIGMAVFGCHGGLPRSRCDLKRRCGDLPQPQRVPAAKTRGGPSAPGSWRAGLARGLWKRV